MKFFKLSAQAQQSAFGKVKLAKNKKTNKWVAIKMLIKGEMIKTKQVDHIMNESTILSNMQHPFIVQMEGICQNDTYLIIVLEFVSGGELFSYLRGIGRFDKYQATFYGGQVTLIFEYLHSQRIAYRDLKPENLLFDQSGYLKLTDFGFAKVIDAGRTYTLCGTPEYLAPEILLNKGHGTAVDWWTLGIFIYELNAGIDPFSDEDPMIIYQNILKGKIRFPRNFEKNAKSLVRHLVVADLSKRYGNLKNGLIINLQINVGASDIKKHRWFKELDWDQLFKCHLKVPYKPSVSGQNDTSNFPNYPESDTQVKPVKPNDDPFLKWD